MTLRCLECCHKARHLACTAQLTCFQGPKPGCRNACDLESRHAGLFLCQHCGTGSSTAIYQSGIAASSRGWGAPKQVGAVQGSKQAPRAATSPRPLRRHDARGLMIKGPHAAASSSAHLQPAAEVVPCPTVVIPPVHRWHSGRLDVGVPPALQYPIAQRVHLVLP